ncbi:MAG: hypothetical protein AB1726_00965 [Planctomycetota bacterium]
MTNGQEESPRGGAKEERIHCRRTGQDYDPEEHRRCPYCHGALADVAAGDHARFCDYDPKKDPIHFGFPPDSTRHRTG